MAVAARLVPCCQHLCAGLTRSGRAATTLPVTAWQQRVPSRSFASGAAGGAPPAAMSATAAEQESAVAGGGSGGGEEAEPTAVYVHLPFCKRKCAYCDFPVIAVGQDQAETPHVQDNMRRYVDLVLQEIEATQRLNRGPLQTVFFGGGTPSLISLPLLEQLLVALDRRFGLAPGAEVSIEADPGTFDAPRLRSYMGMGVTRVSVGVQAFQDELLSLCGRAHEAADVYRAVEAVHAAGLPSWSLDLMSGLPQLTEDMWGRNLELALDAQPRHISTYDLQVEDHTPFARRYSPGEAPLPSDESAAAMYRLSSAVLGAAGFERYEVSNFALPGHRCAHNMIYWQGLPYYAFGLGSASYLQGRRFSRPKRLNSYKGWVEQYVADAAVQGPQVAGAWLPRESADERLLDTVMLRLRLADGLDLTHLAASHPQGEEAADVVLRALRPHIESGWAVTSSGSSGSWDQRLSSSGGDSSRASGGRGSSGEGSAGGSKGSSSRASSGDSSSCGSSGEGSSGGSSSVQRVRLTDPDGFVMSNDVISDVFAAFDLTADEDA